MANKYSTAHFAPATLVSSGYVVTPHGSKAAAIKAAKSLPGLVRVQTPSGNLVQYVDNRSGK